MGVEDALDLVGWGQYAGAVKMRPTACAAYVRTDIVTHSLCADQQVEYRCLKDCLVTAAVMCWLDGIGTRNVDAWRAQWKLLYVSCLTDVSRGGTVAWQHVDDKQHSHASA